MSGNEFLADTNSLIYLLDKHPSIRPLLQSSWLYCFITEIELLGKPGITSSQINDINGLLSVCTKVFHEEEINKIAIFLRQNYKIKIPDALISATAIHKKIPLLTFDKDFSRIKELNLILLEL